MKAPLLDSISHVFFASILLDFFDKFHADAILSTHHLCFPCLLHNSLTSDLLPMIVSLDAGRRVGTLR